MRNAYVIDTETIGYHGVAVLIQYAYGDGPIVLHNLWDVPVKDTLELIEKFCSETCVFFNAAFDWFHLCKIYTMFSLLPPDAIPIELPIKTLVEAERDGRDGPCLKPKGVVDLMLVSRKGQFQTLMSRHDIRVTKVPACLAEPLQRELEERIELDGILFANRKDQNAPKWKVFDRIKKGKDDIIDPEFKDVVLKFRPSRALKFLAQYCLNLDPEFHSFKDVYPESKYKIGELGYAPFALGCTQRPTWAVMVGETLLGYAWPRHLQNHVQHWRSNEEARRYAADDIKYTRMLDEYFGYPEEDDDSVLACMVAAVRWHGFEIDTEKVTQLYAKSRKVLEASPVNINKPREVKAYIREVMDETEATLIDKSTKKAHLEKIRDQYVVMEDGIDPELGSDDPCIHCHGSGKQTGADGVVSTCSRCAGKGKEKGAEVCIKCFGEGCERCEGRGYLYLGPTLASKRAAEVLRIKVAAKEVELYKKLLRAGRFHASFKVIGTLSSRMSGGDGLNAQGIKQSEEVRDSFPLKWGEMILSGGDFDGFEVTLADAVFKDDNLRKDLLAGKSIHTAMAQEMYPDKTEEQIKASKGFKDGGDVDMYTRGKQAVFATLYGGDANTINKKLSIPKKIAEQAFDGLQKRYPGIKEAREKVAKSFAALEQHGEVGTGRITYTKPDDYVETFLGFRRYFTLENKLAKALYDLAHNTPESWRSFEHKIIRRDREQTPSGAVSSALYGAAFQVQAANIRAANNHLIQSPGAMITKRLQRRIWDLQPYGVNEWFVAPMNIHDEVLSVTKPCMGDKLAAVVVETVESFRDRVPLIGMKWVKSMDSWAGKKGGGEFVHISPKGISGLDDGVYVAPVAVEELEKLEEEPIYTEPDLSGYI